MYKRTGEWSDPWMGSVVTEVSRPREGQEPLAKAWSRRWKVQFVPWRLLVQVKWGPVEGNLDNPRLKRNWENRAEPGNGDEVELSRSVW